MEKIAENNMKRNYFIFGYTAGVIVTAVLIAIGLKITE